jgi:hypothetical protein
MKALKTTVIIGTVALVGLVMFFARDVSIPSDTKVQKTEQNNTSKESVQVDNTHEQQTKRAIDDSDFLEMVVNETMDTRAQSTFDIIETAYTQGEISLDTALRLKVLALFDAQQVPEEFAGNALGNLEGDMILVEIREQWDQLDEETQKLFEPMFLDPSEEGAFFHPANIEVRQDIISKLAQSAVK